MTTKKKTSHANRGVNFEKKIQNKCDELKEQEIMLISKAAVVQHISAVHSGGGGADSRAYHSGDDAYLSTVFSRKRTQPRCKRKTVYVALRR